MVAFFIQKMIPKTKYRTKHYTENGQHKVRPFFNATSLAHFRLLCDVLATRRPSKRPTPVCAAMSEPRALIRGSVPIAVWVLFTFRNG
jgi:hypothetical protein